MTSEMIEVPEESQLHLKRNRACLQCKRRKVKCDGVRPVCLPCTRAASSARRDSDNGPINIQCTWADETHERQDEGVQVRPGLSRKKTSGRVATLERVDTQAEKLATLEAERDSFKARLTQLEARLAAMSTSSSQSNIVPFPTPGMNNMSETSDPFAPFSNYMFGAQVDPNAMLNQPLQLGPPPTWEVPPELDYTQYFVVPSYWPKNLPAPYLLEHLVDTFFNCVPQAPRILHRAKLLQRIHLQPNHPGFPLPALLHAICAAAAPHTAWVTSLPPQAIYGSVTRTYEIGKDLEDSEDFGVGQAEASRRAYHQGHHRLWLSQGDWAIQTLQAQAILMGVWHSRGLFGAGGACLGDASRLIKELELTNRIHRSEGINSWLNPPASDIDREERLGVVWYVFMFEAFSAVGSYWTVGLDDRLLRCSLPAGTKEFQDAEERIQENPQDAKTPDLFTVHPVADPYVLACKAALLGARARRILTEWTQRRRVEGDKLLGMETEDFRNVYQDIIMFQQSVPDSIKHVFRVLNSGSHRVIDYNILAVHLMPHITIIMLFEPFIDLDQPHAYGLPPILKAINGVMSVIHLIPSNFDVNLGVNGVLTYNLQICAQFMNQFLEHAVAKQAYAQAIRYRTDFIAIRDLLSRLGGKHAVAYYSTAVLDGTLQWHNEGFNLSEDSSQDNTPSPPNGTSTSRSSFDPIPEISPFGNHPGIYEPQIVSPSQRPSFSIDGQIVYPQSDFSFFPETGNFDPFKPGMQAAQHMPNPIQAGMPVSESYQSMNPESFMNNLNFESDPAVPDLNELSADQLAEVYEFLATEGNMFE